MARARSSCLTTKSFSYRRLHTCPKGGCAASLTYPSLSGTVDDAALVSALQRVGLGEFARRLDEKGRWERILDKDQQMALAFANILIRKPRWLVMQDVLEGLEPENESRLTKILATDLTDTTLIYLGRSLAFANATGARALHLEKSGSHLPDAVT